MRANRPSSCDRRHPLPAMAMLNVGRADALTATAPAMAAKMNAQLFTLSTSSNSLLDSAGNSIACCVVSTSFVQTLYISLRKNRL